MNIEILPQARNDLFEGFCFYEDQNPGLGARFNRVVRSAIDSLELHGSVHRKFGHHHRLLIQRFPYAVYDRVAHDTCLIDAVIDCRRDPEWIRKHLGYEEQ